MKKGLIFLLIGVLIVGSFLLGSKIHSNEVDENYTSSYNNDGTKYEESELTGTWAHLNYDSVIDSLLIFNEEKKCFYIYFDYSNFDYYTKDGYVEITDLEIYDYEYLANKQIRCYCDDGETIEFEYLFENDRLVIADDSYKKIDLKTNRFNNVVESWRFFDELPMRFTLINLSVHLDRITFHGDNTFTLETTGGSIFNGDYRVVHDGKSLELSYDGKKDIYTYFLIDDGLMLINSIGTESGRGSTLKNSYSLLEIYW